MIMKAILAFLLWTLAMGLWANIAGHWMDQQIKAPEIMIEEIGQIKFVRAESGDREVSRRVFPCDRGVAGFVALFNSARADSMEARA